MDFLKRYYKDDSFCEEEEEFTRQIFKEHSYLFKKKYKFVSVPKHLCPGSGKSVKASADVELDKTNFIKKLKQYKKQLSNKNQLTSSQIHRTLDELKTNNSVDNSNSFGLKEESGLVYLIHKDTIPKKFDYFISSFLFLDVPYNNNKKEGFDLDYNPEFDFESLVNSLFSFYNSNTNKKFTTVIFCGDNYMELILKIEQKFKRIAPVTWNKCTLVKMWSNKPLGKMNSKGFSRNHEDFIILSFTETINETNHSLNHNNLIKSLKLEGIFNEIEKKSEKNDDVKTIKDHLINLNKFHCGSDVFFSYQNPKLKIDDKVVNIFEKPKDLLENLSLLQEKKIMFMSFVLVLVLYLKFVLKGREIMWDGTSMKINLLQLKKG
jgi:hypothetical protein